MVNNSPAIRELADSIWDINRRLTAYEMTPQLPNTSLDNTGLNVYDSEGNKTGVVGRLPDGSTGVQVIDGPTPAAPSGITSEPGLGNLSVTWDGLFAGEAPLDFKHVAIHASATADFEPTPENVVTTFSAVEPTTRIVPLAAGTYFLKATTLSIPGKRSDATAEVEAVAGGLVDEDSIKEALETERTAREEAAGVAAAELATLDGKLVTARTDLDAAGESLDSLRDVELPAMRTELEQADSAASAALTELDNQLAGLAGTPAELESIRSALADAQEAVTGAQTTASEAVTAANAASQAALEAAGIAASKGRVIVQATEPQGEDRNSSNIWIQPVTDDPETEVQEKAVTYVYLEASDSWEPTTSSELAQAAQNALDAREAAQQAQQRADTAIANAAEAHSAAQAAQQTADSATLAAADAHNEAVAARQRSDALMESGESLLVNGGFEQGGLGWEPQGARTFIIEGSDAYAGTHFLRLTPHTLNTYPYADPVAAQTGRTYRVSYMVRYTGTDGTGRIRQYNQVRKADGTSQGQFHPDWYAAEEFAENTWNQVTFDLTVTVENAVAIQFAPHFGVSPNTYDVDEFRAVDITEALVAMKAAEDAQDRAEEAYGLAESKANPEDVAAAIATSANGKNSITISTSGPSGLGVADGDVWWQRDSDSNIFGQWVWGAEAQDWIPRQIRSEVIANLDVHKLQVTGDAKMATAVIDKLWVDGLAVKTITASSLIVSTGNMVPDPLSRDPETVAYRNSVSAGWSWDGTDKYWKKVSEVVGNNAINFAKADGPYITSPLTPGQRYSMTYEVWIDAGSASGRFAIRYRMASGSQSYVGDSTENDGDIDHYDPITGGQWVTVTRSWDAPEDAVTASFDVQVNNVVGATELRVRNPIVRPAVGAVLIENGAVNADKINAESVGAAVGEFVEANVGNLTVTDGLVTPEAVIDKLWTDGLVAKSITASRLAVAPGNLHPDPYFQEEENWYGGVSGGSYTDGPSNRLTLTPTRLGAYYAGSNSRTVKIEPGASYRVRAGLRFGGTSEIERVYFYVRGNRKIDGSQYSGGFSIWRAPETSYSEGYGEAIVEIPDDIREWVTVGWYIYSGTTSGAVEIWDASLVPMVGAVLIEDGAVNADKLAADSVLAGKIKAGEIETPHMKANSINADRLTANSITADQIDATSIGSELVEAGTLRTGTTGERLELNAQGVVLYGADAAEGERVRLGPSGENLLTIGTSTISDSNISSATGNYDQLSIGGEDINALLSRLPKGRIGQNRYEVTSAFSSEQQIRLATTVEVEAGRQYRVQITPFDAQAQGDCEIIYRLGWYWGAGAGSWDTVNVLGWGRNQMNGNTEQQLPGIVGEIFTSDSQSGPMTFTFFTSTTNSNGVRLVGVGGHPLFLTVDDMGPRVADAGAYWTYGNGGGGDTTPPPPSTTRYQNVVWGAGGFGGDVSAGEVIQGKYGSYSNRSGGWTFPTALKTALDGSTIEKFEVYLYASHWYYGAGGTASIRPNNGSYTGFVGTAFTSANWPRGAGRWVTVPSSWHASIANGTYGGIGVQTGSTSLTYYGRFTGSATKFRATYRK